MNCYVFKEAFEGSADAIQCVSKKFRVWENKFFVSHLAGKIAYSLESLEGKQ